ADASEKQNAKSADEHSRVAENRSSEKQEDKKATDNSKGSQKQSDSEQLKEAGKQIADAMKGADKEATEAGKNPDSGKDTKSGNQQNLQAANQEDTQARNQQEATAGGEQQNKDAANPLTTLAAEQTAKAMPQLSDELLKKAAELRA